MNGAPMSGAPAGLSEMGKDIYLAAKESIRGRLKEWAEARNFEAHRERIRFTLTESGEMLISMRYENKD